MTLREEEEMIMRKSASRKKSTGSSRKSMLVLDSDDEDEGTNEISEGQTNEDKSEERNGVEKTSEKRSANEDDFGTDELPDLDLAGDSKTVEGASASKLQEPEDEWLGPTQVLTKGERV